MYKYLLGSPIFISVLESGEGREGRFWKWLPLIRAAFYRGRLAVPRSKFAEGNAEEKALIQAAEETDKLS